MEQIHASSKTETRGKMKDWRQHCTSTTLYKALRERQNKYTVYVEKGNLT